MEGIDLLAYPRGEPEPRYHPLPLGDGGSGCTVQIRCLPGASHVHVVLQAGERIGFRGEIPAEGGERLMLQVDVNGSGDCEITCPGREVLRLPEKPSLVPPRHPIVPGENREALEVALVVDGTTRFFSSSDGRSFGDAFLLADRERWAGVADKLLLFLQALERHYEVVRVALVAFGDRPIANATALDLEPAYLLFPEDDARRMLRQWNPDAFRDALLAIPPSSGGDFVDALGDALAACSELYWNPAARKLVLLFGDSPGHSILHPIPRGGDAGARRDDVDVEVLRLFRRGVELATIYQDPAPAFLESLIASQRKFQQAAREQYRRLASLPELAFAASAFDGDGAAQGFLSLLGWIGRGGCYGELLEITPARLGDGAVRQSSIE